MSNTAAWLPSSYSFLTCLCMAERGVNIWCTKAWTCLPHTHRGSVSLYHSRMSRQDRALFPASLCPDYLCCLLHFDRFLYPSSPFLILRKKKLLYFTKYNYNSSLVLSQSSGWIPWTLQPPVRDQLVQTLKTQEKYHLNIAKQKKSKFHRNISCSFLKLSLFVTLLMFILLFS